MSSSTITVEVVRAWPRRHATATVRLSQGATVADALANCGLSQSGIEGHAVFGERVDVETVLHDGDRLELLQALQIDPKESRRRRAKARDQAVPGSRR